MAIIVFIRILEPIMLVVDTMVSYKLEWLQVRIVTS